MNSEEINGLKYLGASRQWATGAITTHREYHFTRSDVYTFLPNFGIRIERWTGLYLDLSDGRTIQEALKNERLAENPENYDEFVNRIKPKEMPIHVLMAYDVQIKEPSGALVSYTFDLFKKILFPNE